MKEWARTKGFIKRGSEVGNMASIENWGNTCGDQNPFLWRDFGPLGELHVGVDGQRDGGRGPLVDFETKTKKQVFILATGY